MRFQCRIDSYSSTALRFCTEGAKTRFEHTTAGAYLVINQSQNCYIEENSKFEFFKVFQIHVFVKQIVYIGVIDPVESKSGLIFDRDQLLLCHLAICAENFQ